ncbi:MAG: hypothetical protein ABL916_07515 [Burkholderiaceae bacterium]
MNEPAFLRLRSQLATAAIELDALGQRLSRIDRQHGAEVLAQAAQLASRCRQMGSPAAALGLFFPIYGPQGLSYDDSEGGHPD